MKSEIERKFLVKRLPKLSGLKKIHYERYFLFRNKVIEMRIQNKGNKFEFERKFGKSRLERKVIKFEITKDEFMALKKLASEAIIRDSYQISKRPDISIKVYYGRFKRLIRVEVEFKNLNEAKRFKPLSWFGNEITNSHLGRDARLLNLKNQDFKRLLRGKR